MGERQGNVERGETRKHQNGPCSRSDEQSFFVNSNKNSENKVTFPVRDTSPVIAKFCRTGLFVARDNNAVIIVQPAEGPSLGVAPCQRTIRQMTTERRIRASTIHYGRLRVDSSPA